MMTMKEAYARMSMYHMRLEREVDGEYRVTFMELPTFAEAEASAYYTDDLEDAVLTGARMRREQDEDNGKLIL